MATRPHDNKSANLGTLVAASPLAMAYQATEELHLEAITGVAISILPQGSPHVDLALHEVGRAVRC
jgi:hypothetical protein